SKVSNSEMCLAQESDLQRQLFCCRNLLLQSCGSWSPLSSHSWDSCQQHEEKHPLSQRLFSKAGTIPACSKPCR
uniref:Uncharacterized protein n=1 Tax=Dromaius novaehollandiae TaxID=8790 RepID=A0A8C4JNS4_DRONO